MHAFAIISVAITTYSFFGSEMYNKKAIDSQVDFEKQDRLQ